MGKALGCWLALALALAGFSGVAPVLAANPLAEGSKREISSGNGLLASSLADIDLACFTNTARFASWGESQVPAIECGECCSAGLVGNVDWLNWTARRRGMDYATFMNPVWLTPVSVEELAYERQSGLRAGLGWRFATCWDLSWNYTYFHSDDSGSVSTTDEPGLVLNGTRSALDTTLESASANAGLDYHINDLEAGRWFALDEKVSMRLFGGFRWAMIDQELSFDHAYRDGQAQLINGDIETPTNMDGYGIRVGTEAHWKSGTGFSLFARGAGAVLVGKFNTRLVEVDEAFGTIVNFSDSYTQAVPNIEAAAGVAWCRGPWEISGGYELNSWFNMAEVDRASYDLILDGFFLRLGFSR